MNDKLNLFFEYLTVELGLASNTRLAYERDSTVRYSKNKFNL